MNFYWLPIRAVTKRSCTRYVSSMYHFFGLSLIYFNLYWTPKKKCNLPALNVTISGNVELLHFSDTLQKITNFNARFIVNICLLSEQTYIKIYQQLNTLMKKVFDPVHFLWLPDIRNSKKFFSKTCKSSYTRTCLSCERRDLKIL